MKKNKRRKKKMFGTTERPRLVVFKSLKHVYGQIIDDTQKITLVGASSKSKLLSQELKTAKSKTEVSSFVGKLLADQAKKKKITRVLFDRNGYAYHGRVKALAEAARKAGLEF